MKRHVTLAVSVHLNQILAVSSKVAQYLRRTKLFFLTFDSIADLKLGVVPCENY